MALHRSKLGPVGGVSGGGRSDGGVAVDLDPLSAFALMGNGTEDANAPGEAAPVSRAGSGSSSGTTRGARNNQQQSAPIPTAVQPPTQPPRGSRGWHAVEINPPTSSSRALGTSTQVNPVKAIGNKTGGAPFIEVARSPERPTEKVDPLEMMKNEGIECLDGELLLVKLQNASCEGLHGKMVPGVLIMTTYKLVVIPHSPSQRAVNVTSKGMMGSSSDARYLPFGHLPKEFVQVPMTYIDKIERDSDRKGTPRADRYFSSDVVATIHCKDVRRIRVSFGGNEESERAMKMLQQLAFPGMQIANLFAFSHRTVGIGTPDPGWHIYDAAKEFDRMGALKPRRNKVASPWRETNLNANYGLCGSYPSVLVVPACVTDDEVKAVSHFRSEQRVPVLCWGRQADSASIWRSSQPKIGISRAACAEDENMLASVAACAPARILPIVDCRPRSSATANFAAGYGYESYPDCPLEFSGIGNIHVMRESLAKLEGLCLGGTAKDQDWTAAVEDTRWLSHVRTVISAAWTVAFKAHTQRTPVLVHCSHGWDRTSQVCSLAQMLLDPYYRTMDGFQVLIEKDWLAFGHPFHLRHAYGVPRGATSGKEDQRSPIFLQFLDCMWQLVMQMPSYFEFNPRFLLCIADHIQTCRFGTFLCNTNKARKENSLYKKCASLWTFLELHRPTFLSQLYQEDTQAELLPPLSSILRHVQLWNDYFLRWSPAASFMTLPMVLRDSVDVHRGISEGRKSTTGEDSDGEKTHWAKTACEHQQTSGSHAEQGHSAAIPTYRCEFDEMERWIALRGLEAGHWRRKAENTDVARDASAGEDGRSTTPESEAKPEDLLGAARKEIEELKAALAEKEQFLSVILSQEETRQVSTPQRETKNAMRAHSAPSRPARDRRQSSGDDWSTTTSRTHGDGTLAERAKAAAVAAAEIVSDEDDEGWVMSRPRGLSSTAESREVRRSSMSDALNFEEDRGRCLTGAMPDVSYDGTGAAFDGPIGGAGSSASANAIMRNDTGQGSRTNSGWKWDFKGWHTGAGIGSGGTTMGKKRSSKLSRKPS